MNYLADSAGEIKSETLPGSLGEFAILEVESEIWRGPRGLRFFFWGLFVDVPVPCTCDEGRDASTPQ